MAARARQIDLAQPEGLRSARSYLEYVRLSSPAGAPCTVSGYVGLLLGKAKNARDADPLRWLIQYTLDFANGDTDYTQARKAIKSGKMRPATGSTPPPSIDQQLEILDVDVKAQRVAWREFLEDVLHQRSRAAEHFQSKAAQLLEKVWILPAVERSPKGGLKVRDHWIILDLDAFEALISSLLLDADRPFGSELKKCRLPECGRFFLMHQPISLKTGQKTGRPQTRYCTPAHMLEAHDRRKR